jgi:DNA-binding beta-propeller fold protein YncE
MTLCCRASKPSASMTTCVVLSVLLLLALSTSMVHAAYNHSSSATAVWGHPDLVSVDRRCSHASSMTLCGPTQVAPDDRGNLWVADLVHSRVLMFPPGSAIAAKVFGQYGSMTTRGCDQSPPRGSRYPAAPNRYTLCQPAGIAIDHQGTLYVADSLNNRILVYFHAAQKPADASADRVLGQADFHASASNDLPARGVGQYRCLAPRPASACTLNSPMELSLTPGGGLLVPDLDNHRVLLWSTASLAHLQSSSCVPSCALPASRVWGQYGSFHTTTTNNPDVPAGAPARCTPVTPSTPASACTLSEPWSALGDAQGNLFIADTANNRVLEYDGALETGRQDACTVFGQQGSFVSTADNLDGVSAASLWHPIGLALDPADRLWVTDYYNMRALAFVATQGTRMSVASEVLGQAGDFSSNGCHSDAAGLCSPTGIAFDAAGYAFVADGFNDRILAYFSPPISLARIDHLTVIRHGMRALVRWHSSGPIRGFSLYLGRRRLTAHLLVADGRGNCQQVLHWNGTRLITLHVLLHTGQEVNIIAF